MIVGDVNDNEPVFDESLILITINEREELNQVLIDISASDADQGANGIILYSVLGGQGIMVIAESNSPCAYSIPRTCIQVCLVLMRILDQCLFYHLLIEKWWTSKH